MSGFQEILLIAVIFLLLFTVPRMTSRGQAQNHIRPVRMHPKIALSGRTRLAVVLSLLWPLGWAARLKPWNQDMFSFLLLGLGPVAFSWALGWVILGFKKHRK